eukprot:GHVS01038265.1.p1 GENE.GHVS01038265.1~~GHVS01038265.1.p1  ORF type:complete len:156 (+),score=8.07 GHVS01038265.1:373-840(+)
MLCGNSLVRLLSRLYCMSIDIGKNDIRIIASGLRGHIKKEKLESQKVLVLANMKGKNLKGVLSHGKVLRVSKEGNPSIELLLPPADAPVGELVRWEGLTGDPDLVMNTLPLQDPFVGVKDSLRTDKHRIAFFKDHKFITSRGPCLCDNIANGSIS